MSWEGSSFALGKNVGKEYYIVVQQLEKKTMIYNAHMLPRFKSNWGTCMLQSWIPRFNSKNPNNLSFSTLVTLRNLSYEHCDQADFPQFAHIDG